MQPLALTEGGGAPAFLGELVALLVAAGLIGFLSARARVVPIVGFLMAGVLIGPNALGLVRQQEVVDAAAEIGVILLLFSIGIEFSLDRLGRIKRLVLLGGGLQVATCVALTAGVLAVFGVSWREAVFSGFLVALSSTAIVLKLLGDRGERDTEHGQLSLALLIFQDLAVVLMVLLVPLLAGSGGSAWALPVALGKAAGIIALVLVLARRAMPPLLELVARLCSPEVFLLAVIAICFGTAYLTSLAGVSVSLGAFLAGLIVSESEHSEHALGEILPLQILFSATFFISIGMLLDVGFLAAHLPFVLAAVLFVLVIKLITTGLAARLLGVGAGSAAAAALLLAQVGEFSFVLERTGAQVGLTPAGLGQEGSHTFIAATVLLMAVTPWLGSLGGWINGRVAGRARRRPSPVDTAALRSPDGQSGRRRLDHVVVLGYGLAGRGLAADLAGAGVAFTVVTLGPEGAREAERFGYDVLRGDYGKLHILQQAGIPEARLIVIPDDDGGTTLRVTTLVRQLNPTATVVVRPLGRLELEELAAAGVDKVVEPERASHLQLSKSVLAEIQPVRHERTVVDTSRLVQLALDPSACPHMDLVQPVLPNAAGCADCLRIGSSWVHLRICLTCGNVGCCDSSPNRHARAHFHAVGHPIAASVEPGEDWAWCFLDERLFEPRPGVLRTQP
jgi:monovalent cation:H+ antiporter-2, CPA2 family